MSTVQVQKSKISSDLKLLISTTAKAESEETSITLTSYYEKCINQAIIDGWPKHEISAKLLKELDLELFNIKKNINPEIHPEECKINRTSFLRVSRRLDCTDPRYNRYLERVTHVSPENSSTECVPLNYRSTVVLNNIINLCHELKKKLSISDKILFELFDEKTRNNFYKESQTILDNLDAAYDDKVKVPSNLEHLFVSIVGESTTVLNKGAIRFMEERMRLLSEQGKKVITLKQTNKFLKNLSTSKLQLFHPHDLQQALFDGFVGVQCVKCESWKVREYESSKHKLQCQDCENLFPAVNLPRCSNCHLLFYRENILHIIENGSKCPQCENSITLYEDLKQWALHG